MAASPSSRTDPSATDVLVTIVPDQGDPAADHRMLAALARQLTPLPDDTTITHHCDACGSAEHGRPQLSAHGTEPVPPVHLSLSRAAGHVALAATLAGPIGIDIESPSAVRTAGFDDVAFDAGERAALKVRAEAHGPPAADRMRTLAWAAKEAVLKAAGTGLRADPRTVLLDLTRDEDPAMRTGSPRLVVLSEAPAEVLGCLAVVAYAPPRIRFVTAPRTR
ncbi:4'-phosphopantetheinyl transferase family protein [Herbiconiux sp. UC225_62]|uniref:4'-phosphopantetheinyl transferase family protein n=1 Tax=Herbiconiux sp. UC225_62 TaxID=3350168 RepID=UPI0036D39C94